MKRIICLLLVALLMLAAPLTACANDVTATAFKMMFLGEMQYYGSGATWTEKQEYGKITETAYLNGNQYQMTVWYKGARESGTGVEKATALQLTGPFSELNPDYDYETGCYSFRPGLNFLTAFFYAVFDLGIMPDNDDGGCFYEAGLLSTYGTYNYMTTSGDVYYDHSTWKSVYHTKGYLEALHYNGVRVIISASGSTFTAYIQLP